MTADNYTAAVLLKALNQTILDTAPAFVRNSKRLAAAYVIERRQDAVRRADLELRLIGNVADLTVSKIDEGVFNG